MHTCSVGDNGCMANNVENPNSMCIVVGTNISSQYKTIIVLLTLVEHGETRSRFQKKLVLSIFNFIELEGI